MNFALTPSVNIQRSKFNRVSSHKTSFNMGEIVPIYLDEVLPGDTRSIDYASLIRMSTPIAPIMDDIYLDLFAFFVPNRITWNEWKEFMGENTDGPGAVDPNENIIPHCTVDLTQMLPGTLGNYLGLPYVEGNAGPVEVEVSELPLRGYYLIKNRWFRNQNVEGPIFVDTSEVSNSEILYNDHCEIASKKADYFTKALPYAQKSVSPVMLPLGTSAPIITLNGGTVSNLEFTSNKIGAVSNVDLVANRNAGTNFVGITSTNSDLGNVYARFNSDNYKVDLTAATAATINQLREAFAIQRLFEKDALYGSRYWELLYAHFGVRSPDSTLQDPELLGSAKIDININQVLQQSGYSDDAGSLLGAVGANSVSGSKGNLFTKSFVEHGYIFILAVARHKETYAQGIEKHWTRQRRFDFYFPTFAKLGNQPVLNKELFATGDATIDDAVFGYQEAWAEYRYKPSRVSGLLNPVAPNNLSFWVLTQKFDTLPTLSTDFTKVNRLPISRALVSGDTGPDFIADFAFKDEAVRPMPLHSIPGLTEYL